MGNLSDVCFMVGLLGAPEMLLGFGTPMIAAGISHIFGFEESHPSRFSALAFRLGRFYGIGKVYPATKQREHGDNTGVRRIRVYRRPYDLPASEQR